jgi:outer membrane protein
MKIKKLIIFSFLALFTLCTFAQNKFGYIDSSELLSLMPEKKKAEGELQTFAKSLESQLGAMQAEYQASVQDYQANEATYDDLVKQDKISEITNLEQRIQAFQQNAQNALQKKEQELLEPILAKARTAIEDVAKEGKFTFIFDSSMGSILYADENENVMLLVKKKLGL